jgi:hypothetical protein
LEQTLAYKISEIPDAFYHQYQMTANGDVLAAVGQNFEHLLRSISILPPGSVSVSIRFRFTPVPKSKDNQSRLVIYILARANHSNVARNLPLLFESGPLVKFIHLEKTQGFEAPWGNLQAVCEIVRRQDTVMPLHQNDVNDRIPPYYYTISSFEPNDRNDYLDLDRLLGSINETVILDICIEPADIKSERLDHVKYLSLLQSINRIWDRDGDEEPELINFFGDDSTRRPVSRKIVKPLRYKDPIADDIFRSQQRFHETLRQPHLSFSIRVLSESPEAAQLIGSVVGESIFENGSYQLVHREKGEKSFDEDLLSIKEARIPASFNSGSLLQEENFPLYTGLSKLCRLGTVGELSGVFRVPVASQSSPCCIRKNTDPPKDDPRNLIVLGFDQENPGISRGIPYPLLCKHGFISGVPGSGKTTSVINVLLELHRDRTPFLVLEPVKTEYRILKTLREHNDENARSLAKNLEVYTAGDESVSPFRFNPLEVPSGISIDEHIDNILWSFKAAMPLEGPMQALLGEALEQVYEEYPDPENPPLMTDLVSAAGRVLDSKGYSAEVHSNIKAALEVRLGMLTRRSIGKVFECRQSVPQIDQLMEVPAIIELDRLHPEQACLLTLFMLTRIREYLRTVQKSNKNPRYVIIIEEAHNIVGSSNGKAAASPDIANPKAFAVEFICNMLAELRDPQIGILIIDQLPSAVAPEVMKNTNMKLAFRQVADQDRKELGGTMLFGQWEIEEIARLSPGEAFFYTEGFYKPRRIKTLNLNKRFDFSTPILREKVIPYIQDDPWYKNAAIEMTFQALERLRESMDDFDKNRIVMIRDLVTLRDRHAKIIAKSQVQENPEIFVDLRAEALALENRVNASHRSFLKNTVDKYLLPEPVQVLENPTLRAIRDDLVDRYESIIQPGIQEALNRIKLFMNEL